VGLLVPIKPLMVDIDHWPFVSGSVCVRLRRAIDPYQGTAFQPCHQAV